MNVADEFYEVRKSIEDLQLHSDMQFVKKQFFRHRWLRGLISFLISIPSIFIVAKIVLKLWDKFIENNLIGATIFSIVCGIMIMYAGFSLTYIISVYSDDENQRQYFTKGGMLIVLITRDDGYPFYWHFGWKVRRTICFTKIEKIKKRPCSIVIIGNIIVYKSQWKMIYTYDLKATKVKKKYRIPRNFSHEEQILDINIEEYNRKMTKLDIDITDFYVNRKRIPDKYLKAENRR